MIKCNANRCPRDSDCCCFNCGYKGFCEDVCTKDVKRCENARDTQELRREAREKRMDARFLRLYILGLVAFLFLTFALMVVIGNQNTILKTQVDIADQVNYIGQEVER